MQSIRRIHTSHVVNCSPLQAAELCIVPEVHRWHCLVQAALVLQEEEGGLSRFERARLATLLLAISAHQEAVLQRRVASMTQLVRRKGGVARPGAVPEAGTFEG